VMDDALFACNYLNSPADEVTAVFKGPWLRFYTRPVEDTIQFIGKDAKTRFVLVRDLDRLMSVDPAFSEAGNENSRAAIVVTGSLATGEHVLLEATAMRTNLDAVIAKVVEFAKTYMPRKLLIERVAQQVAFILLVKQALDKAGLPIPIEEVRPGGRHKEVRIRGIEPYFQRGNIIVDARLSDFLDEYRDFPRGRHVDLLDALAYLPEFWMKPAMGAESYALQGEARVAKEMEVLSQRLGRPMGSVAPPKSQAGRIRPDGSRRW
jgi:predicted phage terminase large subunit-like protein